MIKKSLSVSLQYLSLLRSLNCRLLDLCWNPVDGAGNSWVESRYILYRGTVC
jgi:hypothetical protein